MTVFTPATPTSSAAAPVTPRGVGGRAPATSESRRPRYWPTWTMLSLFIFISFECILLAAALKGSWFILLAPGVVCGVKALDSWRLLQKAMAED